MLIPVLLGVMLVVFIFQAISPDDPARMLLGYGATEEQVEAMQVKLGLDQPIAVQYVRYVWNLIRYGDLGTSYSSGQPVLSEIMVRFPITLRLAVISVFVGVLIGVPLGILSAVKQYSWVDNAILGFSVFISSFPGFWLALLLIVLFSVRLGWLPSMGIIDWKGWIMPTVVIALGTMTMLIRNTRASMLEAIRQDYVRMARAKGQSENKIIYGHVLRNSMIPIVNTISITIGGQLGGALIIESVFGIAGIGMYALTAIGTRNYPAVLGSVVVLAFTFTVINLLVDVCYAIIDPKLRITFVASSKARKLRRMARKRAKAARAAY